MPVKAGVDENGNIVVQVSQRHVRILVESKDAKVVVESIDTGTKEEIILTPEMPSFETTLCRPFSK